MALNNIQQPNDLNLFCEGLNFTTSGTTGSSQLNYYETLTMDAQYSGAFTNVYADGITLTRIGNAVFCGLKGNNLQTATATSSIIIGTIPDRFCPTDGGNITSQFIPVTLNSAPYITGRTSVDINGLITIRSDTNFGQFPSGATGCGFSPNVTLEWQVI